MPANRSVNPYIAGSVVTGADMFFGRGELCAGEGLPAAEPSGNGQRSSRVYQAGLARHALGQPGQRIIESWLGVVVFGR